MKLIPCQLVSRGVLNIYEYVSSYCKMSILKILLFGQYVKINGKTNSA